MLVEWLTDAARDPLVLVLAIVAATFVLEDAATITVALLAGAMVVDGRLALAAATAGTVLGDLALYAVARWAGDRRLVRGWLARPAVAPVLDWMRGRALPLVVLARFTPGLRLPVYVGAGAIRMPFAPFALAVGLSSLVWTPGLYWAASRLDGDTLMRLGAPGWVLAAALIGGALLLPRATGRALAWFRA